MYLLSRGVSSFMEGEMTEFFNFSTHFNLSTPLQLTQILNKIPTPRN